MLKQTAGLSSALQATDHLSPCVYSTAIHSLWPGQGRKGDIKWLLAHRNPDGSWGSRISWQEMYLNTYASGVALLNAGYAEAGQAALRRLPAVLMRGRDNRTLNFGGLVGVLDSYARAHLKIEVNHPPVVQQAVAKESKKWAMVMQDGHFYDPAISIAGFFGESCYSHPEIDLQRFVQAFQTPNGSITQSPAASALCLLAWQERGLPKTKNFHALRWYVENLDASMAPISFQDELPFQVAVWALLYIDEVAYMRIPDLPIVDAIRAKLKETPKGIFVNGTGSYKFPGDLDTTACAVISLRLPEAERRTILQAVEPFFAGDHYQTFLYEHTLSTTTNIHAAAAWPENPHLETVIDWLADQYDENGFIACKWHASPYYPITEVARLLADSPSDKARQMAYDAGQLLLREQRADGGWGNESTTCEETSYAVLALSRLRLLGKADPVSVERALKRAWPVLEAMPTQYEPLWICKTLYSMPPVSRLLQRLARRCLPVNLQARPQTRPLRPERAMVS